jgi:hypothetical protein
MNACEQMESLYTCIYARALLNALETVSRQQCFACKTDDLSQRHHDCIMLSDVEKLNRYFVILLDQVNADDVFLQWSECVTAMSPDLMTQRQFKLYDDERRNTLLECVEWERTLFDTVLQMLQLSF